MHYVHAEEIQSNCRAHDIDDGVRGADFVEVDVVHGLAVNVRFRHGDRLEHGEGTGAHRRRKARSLDDGADGGKAPRRAFDAVLEPHRGLGAGDAHLRARRQLQIELVRQRQLAEFGAQVGGGHAHVDERTQMHVAGNAGEALVEERLRQRRGAPRGLFA